MSGLYTSAQIQEFMNKALDMGYEYVPYAEPGLGCGNFVLMAPPCQEPGRYYPHIIVEEVFLNEWCSAHKVRRCRKISKKLQKLIKEYDEND